MAEEWEHARQCLGKQVKIVLNHDDPQAIVEGKLLALCDDGAFAVLDDGGMTHYCWPMLKVVEL